MALSFGQLAAPWAHLAESTADAYSFNAYGAPAWRACYALLYRRGYNACEAMAIMRSKLTRLAADDRRSANVTSADLGRFLDAFPPAELRGHVDDYVLGINGPDADDATPVPSVPCLRLVWSAK
jgi:hypothetical protein